MMRLPISPLCRDYLAIWFVGRFSCGFDDEPDVAASVEIGERFVDVPGAMVPRFRELLLEAINADSDAGESVRMLNAASKLHQQIPEDRPRQMLAKC